MKSFAKLLSKKFLLRFQVFSFLCGFALSLTHKLFAQVALAALLAKKEDKERKMLKGQGVVKYLESSYFKNKPFKLMANCV